MHQHHHSRLLLLMVFCSLAFVLPALLIVATATASGQDGGDAEFEAQRLQQEAQERFAAFEARLETLAQKLEKSEPERAERLREAFRKCPEEGLAKNLGDLVRQLNNGDLDEAAELQKQVADDLRGILLMLMQQGTDPDETRQQRDELRERLEAIEDLIERQKSNLDSTRAGDKPEGELSDTEQKLADDTKQLGDPNGEQKPDSQNPDSQNPDSQNPDSQNPDSQNPDSQNPDSQQPQSSEPKPGDESLQKAAESMQKATDQMKQGEPSPSAESQEQALEELDQARKETEDALKEAEQAHQEARLAQLEQLLAKMIRLQKAVNSDTAALAEQAADLPTGSRVLRVRALQLATAETEVRDTHKEFDELLQKEGEEQTAMRAASLSLGDDIDHLTMRLRGALLDNVTTQMEGDILALMEALLAAVKQAQQEQQQQQQQEPQDPQEQDPQQQQQPPDDQMVPDDADLRLMRMMQAQLLDATKRFDKARNPGVTTDEEEMMLKQLAARQQRIIDLMKQYLDKKEQDDPDSGTEKY